MNELFSLNNSTSGLEKSVNTFLQYYIPILTGLSTPLSFLNLVIFLNIGILNSPSNLIYFNLVIIDLLNSLIGIGVSVVKWRDPASKEHWGNDTPIDRVASYLYIFTFDANIFLVFGLTLIRVLWLQMSALSVIRKLNMLSWVAVGLSNLLGMVCCLYAHFQKSLKKKVPYPDAFIEAMDLFECVMILITISLSLYTQIRIRCHKSKINTSTYNSASITSFVITLNLAVSYSYYLVVNGARIYYKPKENNDKKCKDTQWTWEDIFLCDSLYMGVSFMCLNSLVNSVILLCQVRSKQKFF